MFFYCIVFGVALTGIPICWIRDPARRRGFQTLYFASSFLFLTIFAGIRSARTDRDYSNYLEWFNEISRGSMSLLDSIKDPAFVLLSYPFAKAGLHYAVVLTILVAIALVAKLQFAKIACDRQWLTLFFFLVICRFFLPQEMTAIRVAAAIPFMSMSIIFAFRRRYAAAMGAVLAAVAFHLSAAVAIPILILIRCGARFRSVWWIVLLLPAGIALYFSLQGILEAAADFSRFAPYVGDNPDVDIQSINFLSIYLLAHVMALLFVIFGYWRQLEEEERLITFCSALGLFFQLVFASNNVLALRAAELFGLFDILLFLVPLRRARNGWVFGYAACVVAFGASLFISTVRIMQPYDWMFARYQSARTIQLLPSHRPWARW